MLVECKDGKLIPAVEWSECLFDMISPVTKKTYCYSTEASNYA